MPEQNENDPSGLLNDIAYALWKHRSLWPRRKPDPYDHRPGQEPYRSPVNAIVEHLRLIGLTITKRAPARAHSSGDMMGEEEKQWHRCKDAEAGKK